MVFHAPADPASLGDWQFAILALLGLALTAVSLAVRHGRVRRPLGWSGGALVAAACAVAILVPARTAISDSVRLTATERSFLSAINAVRVAHGVGPLRPQGNLVRAARAHSVDMVDNDYFAHGVFWKRLAEYGVRGRDLGENLAWNSTPANAVGTLVHAWLESPDHRANLLNGKFTEVGVGVDIGPFDGYSHALMVTTDFLGN
jgi:uncharacterized protein YkwD